MAKGPNPRLEAFVDAFCTPDTATFGNATESAVSAGYGNKNRLFAAQYACRMLKQARVQTRITQRLAAVGLTPATIRARIAGRFFNEKASNGDVARLGELLAKMTPGALVPSKLEVSGGLTLEDLVPKRKPKEAT